MRPRVISISPYAAADPNAVSVSQTPAAGGIQELTITGVFATAGVATMDTPRQVVITAAANDSARVFVITGTDGKGNGIVEAVAGPNVGTTSTVRAFATVTSVKVDADTAGAIEVGTLSVVSTDWFPLDYLQSDFQIGLSLIIGGALTPDFDVELTLDNILDYQGNDPIPTRGQWVASVFDRFFPGITPVDHDTLITVVADATGNVAFPVRAIRMVSNQVFTVEAVELNIVQGHHGS